MEISAIFFLIALLVLISMYLYFPLMERERKTTSLHSHEVSTLMAERDRIINALQELDFDHTLGKVPAEDYPGQRAILLQKGADVLKKLDEFQPSRKKGETTERLEKAAAARRADASTKVAELNDDEIESMLAARRKEHKGKFSGFCPKCGKPVMAADRFCPSCGKSLQKS
jgi:rubrerythrin